MPNARRTSALCSTAQAHLELRLRSFHHWSVLESVFGCLLDVFECTGLDSAEEFVTTLFDTLLAQLIFSAP